VIKVIPLVGIIITGFLGQAQNPTVGLLFWEEESSDGYTLFTPETSQNVYLINNCGEKINEWNFTELPGLTCYLLENGTLLRAGKNFLEIRDWNNDLLWSYNTVAHGIRQHHDIEPLPNGNILCVVREILTPAEMIAAGRDPSHIGATFQIDKIVELSPILPSGATIVWEWRFMDHLIQDFDNTKLNYGVVADHPELLDINFLTGYLIDFSHVNAVDYNAALDQVIITARHLNELYIIDHSTTTEEAAGHTGGNSNLGGDFMWRWGNPQVYGQGGTQDQKLFLPHDSKWVESGYTDEGKISVFNNLGDGTGTFSSVHLITPDFSAGVYAKSDNKFLPIDFEWTWSGSILGDTVFEDNMSGTQSLPNGNFIICQSSLGQVSEITKNGDHLWTYKNPVGDSIYNQYDVIPLRANSIFRAEKYQEDFPGFSGQDLTPKGLIEDQNTISENCITATGTENPEFELLTVMNPVENGTIRFNENITLNAIIIADIRGKVVYKQGFYSNNNLEVDLKPAIYILQLYFDKKIETRKIIVL